jgi:hypothetical protein
VPADYQAQSVTLTFLSGAVGPAHIAIPIVNDALAEANETFSVQLAGGPVGAPRGSIAASTPPNQGNLPQPLELAGFFAGGVAAECCWPNVKRRETR